MVASGNSILSNWWRNEKAISPPEIQSVLTAANLDRHLHDYAAYRDETPFISLAAGAVLRDPATLTNQVYDALDTALGFATDNGACAGTLFYCWTVVGLHPAVEFEFISEPVRDLLIYRGWSPFNHEGEIAAKVHIPANRIQRIEWWDPALDQTDKSDEWINPHYLAPDALLNERALISSVGVP